MSDQRSSDSDPTKRDIPSFIEPRPPLILNPFMRPRPQKGTNLLELFEEDSEIEEPEWVQVFLRLKPCNVRSNLYEVKSDRCLITSVDTAPMGHGRRTQHHVSKMYTFSHIFGPEANQKEIFEKVVKDNLKKLPDGHNFTLLTYGASGSGKTYTLMGTVQSPGLVPRSLEYVFRVVDAAQQPLYKPVDGETIKLDSYDQDCEVQFVKRLRQVSAPLRDKYRRMSVHLRNDLTTSNIDLSNRTRYFVWVSFIEIYNEAIYDLLANSDRSKATSKLRIREDTNGNVYVKGATQAFVRSGGEAYDVLAAGKHNLQVAATGVHAASSRSHCIFTITMLTLSEEGIRTSCVRLCDLAGCERQRHTKNTGARMQESRAINSSLHVLERCLHMLRRKQKKVDATLVPYRESKLTRLLGAGLCGARGEGVGMVVTLSPAPQYQHETKHVLQLAAVARDIQVNQTVQESTFESSTQDLTIEPSADLMRLRTENEKLHFELIQAESRNKELLERMEEKQQEVAKTMFEMVEEAKDLTRQYYEPQLQALRTEMEEMKEEYENKLNAVAATGDRKRLSNETGTPSKSLRKQVAALMTEIAILEEKLTAEKLARARAEEEVQHLRACIEERDEKVEEDTSENHEDVMCVTDESESEEEDDKDKESLEPTFKKEDINRSRLLRQSLLNYSKHDTSNVSQDTANDEQSTINNNHQAADHEKNETLKDKDDTDVTTVKDFSYLSDHSNLTENFEITQNSIQRDGHNDSSKIEKLKNNSKERDLNQTKSCDLRGTYVVWDDMTKSKDETKAVPEFSNVLTPFENSRKSGTDKEKSFEKNLEKTVEQSTDNTAEQITESIVGKLFNKKPTLTTHPSDVSLANFELLEIASKSANQKIQSIEPLDNIFSNIKILKEKRNYFDDKKEFENLIPKLNKNCSPSFFDNINVGTNKTVTEVKKLVNDERSPSIVKEDDGSNVQPSAMKRLLGESFTRQPDRLSAVTTISLHRNQASVDIFEGYDSPKVVKDVEVPKSAMGKSPASHPSQIYECKYWQEPGEASTECLSKDLITPTTIDSEKSDMFAKLKDAIKSFASADESLTQNKHLKSFASADESLTQKKHHVSTLEKKVSLSAKVQDNIVENTCSSIKNMCLKAQCGHKNEICQIQIKLERPSVDPQINDLSVSSKKNDKPIYHNNNTVDDFDNIYKDITPRDTEFELLISQNCTNITESMNETDKHGVKLKYNLRHTKMDTSADKEVSVDKETMHKKEESSNKKTNSPNMKGLKNDTTIDKFVFISKQDSTLEMTSNTTDATVEVLLESEAKCESMAKPKRNLRLRRRKNDADEKIEKENVKLKDIVNLQNEFSDVTMDVPVPFKETKDIDSPEKKDEENQPPLQGIQSCPNKSVTRSRRKLFTPRAEPLEESMAQSGDSNERIRVPRPSYHRTRARRKL